MGKSSIVKRRPLQRQLVNSFLLILAFSAVTALGAIFTFYYFCNRSYDLEALKPGTEREILEIACDSGSSIIDTENRTKLDEIMKRSSLTYRIKDTENKIICSYGSGGSTSKTENALWRRFANMRDNIAHTSSLSIPLVNKVTGKIAYILVINYRGHLVLVDVFIPFLCFIFFTLVFSRRFSRKIKKPLDGLTAAIERIKSRDLDFVIESSGEDEIGDLAGAFEEMRKNLQDSLVREWQLEQDRRDMVAAITHDMRTPLAIIFGHVEGLQEGLKHDEEKLDEYLGIIEQNSQRARALIDEMNALAEIDSPGFELNCCPLDFTGFINEKISEIELMAGQKGIKLESHVFDKRKDDGLVSADSAMLSRVIDNISGNCIRVTPNGGSIRFEVVIDDAQASFKVSDTGPGFSEKDLANLFKKFYKGDNSRSFERGHSGLGLYIAKSIIKRHGGEITALNVPGGGACVNFSIRFL